ncbi:sugar transporter [Marinomonas gallaica]|uniref:sugar transporter n=1 Tax=Marinomonas gallaica TaxID=1806667 RepID=UPI003CE56EEE
MTQLAPAENTPRRIQYLRVFALGFCAFIFNTSEFVPVGLLSDISNDFGIAPSQTGWMLTIYAWIVGVMSLPMMLITSRMERKLLLLVTCTVFIISHGLSTIAWDFQSLMISRIGVAFAHAVFWSITASIAIRVAPPGKMNFALSVLATGTGMAMVLGVPLGRMIGQAMGWRMAFEVIGLAALVITFLVFRLLPKLPSLTRGDLKNKVQSVFKNKPLFVMYFAVFLAFTAHYGSYSYIEPFLMDFGGISSSFTTVILLTFGLAGIIGSTLFSYLGEKFGKQLMIGSAAGMTICMFFLAYALSSTTALMIITVVWGAALLLTCLAMQARVLSVDSNASDIIMSLFSGIINLGIGAGALVGSISIEQLGLGSIGYVASAIAFIGIFVAIYIARMGITPVATNGASH